MNLKKWMSNRSLLWALAAVAAVLVLLLAGETTPGVENRTEKRMAEVLGSIAGVGNVEVALFYAGDGSEQTGPPTGAVVVAQGAEELAVRLELIRAVRTLLGLPEAAVDVFAMGQ